MTLQRGARLGPYEVLELTGTGGMGEVYKARDARIHRTVALKTLNAVPDDEAGARGQLMREARAVGALHQTHICALHAVGQSGGCDFLVMEFLEGETLSSVSPADGCQLTTCFRSARRSRARSRPPTAPAWSIVI